MTTLAYAAPAPSITAPGVPDGVVQRPRITKLIADGVRWCQLTPEPEQISLPFAVQRGWIVPALRRNPGPEMASEMHISRNTVRPVWACRAGLRRTTEPRTGGRCQLR